jgi:hypothetical protein
VENLNHQSNNRPIFLNNSQIERKNMKKSFVLRFTIVLLILSLVLAGCGQAASNEVEVFSWWTGGGELLTWKL